MIEGPACRRNGIFHVEATGTGSVGDDLFEMRCHEVEAAAVLRRNPLTIDIKLVRMLQVAGIEVFHRGGLRSLLVQFGLRHCCQGEAMP
jgi:hypothetical protein